MLVSAVLDPSAFNASCFDALYSIHALDLLKGIERNGLLIVDSENRLRDTLIKQIRSVPIKYRQRLQILVEEILLKKRSKRVIACFVSSNYEPSRDLLDLAYYLQTSTEADALIVGNESLERLKSDQRHGENIILLSEYRDSNFEKERQRYYDGLEPIDTLSESEVEDAIIRSIRFSTWLRFYDKQIGKGTSTRNFLEGIEYVLSLWREHGVFASQEGRGSVEIYTGTAKPIRGYETDQVRRDKLAYNREQHQKIIRELMEPLNDWFSWPVRLFVKEDPDGIFHARYLEAQYAIIQVERGFGFRKPNDEFWRNFFTVNMRHGSHLRECRELPDADL